MPIKLANREPDEILINDKLKKLRSVEIAGSKKFLLNIQILRAD